MSLQVHFLHAHHHLAAHLPLRVGVVAGVLLAGNGEVVADVGQHGVAFRLRALDRGVVAGRQAQRVGRAHHCVGVRAAVAVRLALAYAGFGVEADAVGADAGPLRRWRSCWCSGGCAARFGFVNK